MPDFLLTSVLLAMTIVAAWVHAPRRLCLAFCAGFLLAGVRGGYITGAAIPCSLALGVLVWASQHDGLPRGVRWLAGVGMVALGIALAIHAVPGFHNPRVFDALYLSPRATPFTMYVNFDKPLFAVFFLIFGGTGLTMRASVKTTLQACAKTLLPLLLIVIPLAMAVNFIAFEPKLPLEVLVTFALNNLLLTCVAEEVFFRGFMQMGLTRALAGMRWGSMLALLVTAVLFGLVHMAGGPALVGFGIVAGLFYGRAMQLTGSLEAAVLCHFGLNIVHFIFFTYPTLAA